jgi:hypothetical protein
MTRSTRRRFVARVLLTTAVPCVRWRERARRPLATIQRHESASLNTRTSRGRVRLCAFTTPSAAAALQRRVLQALANGRPRRLFFGNRGNQVLGRRAPASTPRSPTVPPRRRPGRRTRRGDRSSTCSWCARRGPARWRRARRASLPSAAAADRLLQLLHERRRQAAPDERALHPDRDVSLRQPQFCRNLVRVLYRHPPIECLSTATFEGRDRCCVFVY